MVCSRGKIVQTEEICQRTQAAGTEEKLKGKKKALGENKKNNKKISVRDQKSTTTSCIHNKPTPYAVSSVCESTSLLCPFTEWLFRMFRRVQMFI